MANLSRIFYIYTEASFAVFLLAVASIELLCYLLMTTGPIAQLALVAASVFALIAVSQVLFIIYQERKHARRY